MKTSFLLLGGFCAATAVSATAVSATKASAQETHVATSAKKSKPKAALSYEQLSRSFKVDPLLSIAGVQRDAASNAGRVIEARGTVSGTMTVANVKSVVFRCDDDSTVTFALPPILPGSELLRPGARVRILLLVAVQSAADAAESEATTPAEVSFTPVAVAAAPKPLAPVTEITRNAGSSGGASSDGTISNQSEADAIFGDGVSNPVPPMTGRPSTAVRSRPSTPSRATIPEPPAARPPAIVAARPGIEPDAGDSLEDQKPAYKNLIRRFNRKLNDAQVDEIATALLQAGYQNGMDPRFLAAIIATESDFDIFCLSSSGAMGLGQIMPFNLKEAGITNAWNPTQNVMGTARLLRGHLNDYRNRSDGTLLAVAAYNAGPGAVRRAGYRVPPGKQVQRYVWKVYNRYREFAPDMFK